MSRNNQSRAGSHKPDHAETPVENSFNPLNFVAPTEFVELPSKGAYPEDHPLYEQEVVEIRYMTAKEEDILASETLLKKGIAIERLIDSIIVNKKIKSGDLLTGDRNAIIIATRISGYGANYQTQINCPSCLAKSKVDFDLNDKSIKASMINEKLSLSKKDNGNFEVIMPFSKFRIEFRLLNGSDELMLAKSITHKKKKKMDETSLTDQFKLMISSIEGHSQGNVISQYVDNMPTLDSRHLRACYKLACPNIKVTHDFSCVSCSHEQELEVPFNTDFFWPDR
jgi:hypothetical protein